MTRGPLGIRASRVGPSERALSDGFQKRYDTPLEQRYAFGTHDGYTLWDAPDNVSMAAVALAITSGGAPSSLETTVLLTVDETMDALRKAEQGSYRAPGA